MVINGISNTTKNVVAEYEYTFVPGRRLIDVYVTVRESHAPNVDFKCSALISPRLNRKMYKWDRQRINDTAQRLVELSVIKALSDYSTSGIVGYDVWLKSKQARLHIGQQCNAFYKFCHDRDIYVYREAM